MCGILALVGCTAPLGVRYTALATLQPRGPEASALVVVDADVTLGFQRLAINGCTPAGMQPMERDGRWAICNGEIYNHEDLRGALGLESQGGSDCEVILPLWSTLEAFEAVKRLDGEWALVVYDPVRRAVWAARDRSGVRPLFVGYDSAGRPVAWASEVKALVALRPHVGRIQPVVPGVLYHYEVGRQTLWSRRYADVAARGPELPEGMTRDEALDWIRRVFTYAVERRVANADREVCALLSGGLDSSLVAAIAARALREAGRAPLKTFSVGLPGSPDLAFARRVADHIGSVHHEVLLTVDDFLGEIEPTIAAIESYDTTTVRASVGNRLVARAVRQLSEAKVVLNGDYSDEVCGGYLYMALAPDDAAFDAECRRLVRDIYLFDSLRSDRSIASWGLEARTPFSDPAFIEAYLSLPVAWRRPSALQMEKHFLRQAFEGTGLLPTAVLWRRKEAFSDGVSAQETSWHRILRERLSSSGVDATEDSNTLGVHNPPVLPETAHYRRIFERLYGAEAATVIPYYWLPRWSGDTVDPSARELHVYSSTT